MSHPNPSTALARVVLDELAAGGVAVVVVSPGSRSAALAIAAAEHPDLEVRVAIDERSAAFHALGVAKASGSPAVVISTSGTAPANYLPAVVEADMACVPLVVVSADRPAELRGIGANQTIDQVNLYGTKVRSFTGIEAPDPGVDLNPEWRRLVSDALAAATGPRPGPIHLNVAFREPTVPVPDDGRTRSDPYPYPTPRVSRPSPPATTHPVVELDLESERGVLILGDGSYDRAAVIDFAGSLGWPVLATALSGARGERVVDAYHHLLVEGIPEDLVPDVAVAVGAIGPDPVLEDLVAAASTRVRVDAWGRHIDPGRNASAVVAADPLAVLAEVTGRARPGWAEGWLDRAAAVRDRVRSVVATEQSLTGGTVANAMNSLDWGALVVASSLPVREIDVHLNRPGPVFGNRGASGIDGFVSTALGVASVHPRTVALAGDLSFLHDANGFMIDVQIDCVFVVVDNHGGGLFDALPQAVHAPHFERLFITPSGRSIAAVAEAHHATVTTVMSIPDMIQVAQEGLSQGGVHVIVVPVDRQEDLQSRLQLGR